MPTISRFFGIVVAMYHDDHSPPHFHARYGGDEALIDIDSLMVLGGHLPPPVYRLVREWAALHREGLQHNWDLARAHQPLVAIPGAE